ncbi:Yip1 domain family [Salpingoeca rosetta]|uniref:Protein YIPF n=1 Tax=Salpingoeca rosetta (strain ATCC 50818 / BSB-021) TaxID=946362 RepID=F2TXN4_SALR5|nr:Yip1 domain family [Salpingoeca rosetta]EGD76143.1 Yip1 domain family [Salpingoeca rosetta]|eukprot:XP_004998318.1 Yip1 domain family [Salpingoeca rosetta]
MMNSTSSGGGTDDVSLPMEGMEEMEGVLSGNIDMSTSESQDTLDEPVWDTLKRDLGQIINKFTHVIVPRKGNRELLRNWDLWGPMGLTMTLALLLRETAKEDQRTEVFTGTFFIICAGSAIVTVNNQLLGGTLSIFQGMCVLGYCMFPLVCACILLRFVGYLTTHLAVRFVVAGLGLAWSIYASVGFVAASSPVARRALVVYPIVLYYVFIAWLILNDVGGAPSASPPSPTTATPQPPPATTTQAPA